MPPERRAGRPTYQFLLVQFAEFAAHDLAGAGLGQVLDELHGAGDFVRGQVLATVGADGVSVAGLAFLEDDVRLGQLALGSRR